MLPARRRPFEPNSRWDATNLFSLQSSPTTTGCQMFAYACSVSMCFARRHQCSISDVQVALYRPCRTTRSLDTPQGWGRCWSEGVLWPTCASSTLGAALWQPPVLRPPSSGIFDSSLAGTSQEAVWLATEILRCQDPYCMGPGQQKSLSRSICQLLNTTGHFVT